MKLNKLIIAIAIAISTPTFAQVSLVLDPSALAEAILQTEQMISSAASQIELVAQGIATAEREIQRVLSLPFNLANTIKTRIENNLDTVDAITTNIDEIFYDIGNTRISAEDLFTSDKSYASWFDFSLSQDERRELVEKEFENVLSFYKILEQNVTDAENARLSLKRLEEDTGESIKTILEETQGSESIVAHLQSANLLTVETYTLIKQMAIDINAIRVMTAQSLNRNSDEFDIPIPPGIDGLECNLTTFHREECGPVSGDYRTGEEIIESFLNSGIDPYDPDAFKNRRRSGPPPGFTR